MEFTLGEMIGGCVFCLLIGAACATLVICACVRSSLIIRAQEFPAIEGDDCDV